MEEEKASRFIAKDKQENFVFHGDTRKEVIKKIKAKYHTFPPKLKSIGVYDNGRWVFDYLPKAPSIWEG